MKRQFVEDLTAHLIATLITVGFFATVLVSLLGYVNLKDATTASFVGVVMGYVAGSLNPVLSRYFKGGISGIRELQQESTGQQTKGPQDGQ